MEDGRTQPDVPTLVDAATSGICHVAKMILGDGGRTCGPIPKISSSARHEALEIGLRVRLSVEVVRAFCPANLGEEALEHGHAST